VRIVFDKIVKICCCKQIMQDLTYGQGVSVDVHLQTKKLFTVIVISLGAVAYMFLLGCRCPGVAIFLLQLAMWVFVGCQLIYQMHIVMAYRVPHSWLSSYKINKINLGG
jgi:hypothetical protein